MQASVIAAIKKLIAEDDIDEALDAMQKNITNKRLSDDVVLMMSRHNAVNRELMLNIIDDATARVERSKIRLSLLDILRKTVSADSDVPPPAVQPTTHNGDIIYGNVTKIEHQINMGGGSTYNENK